MDKDNDDLEEIPILWFSAVVFTVIGAAALYAASHWIYGVLFE